MVLSFCANLLLIFDNQPESGLKTWSDSNNVFFSMYKSITILLSTIFILLISIFKLPLMIIGSRSRTNKIQYSELVNDYAKDAFNFWAHLFFALLSSFFSPYFYTLHLLLMITLFESTMFILK